MVLYSFWNSLVLIQKRVEDMFCMLCIFAQTPENPLKQDTDVNFYR